MTVVRYAVLVFVACQLAVEYRRGRHGELTEWRQGIGQATPAIRDRAVIEAKQTVGQVIAQLLRTLLEGIATLDRKIAEAAEVLMQAGATLDVALACIAQSYFLPN